MTHPCFRPSAFDNSRIPEPYTYGPDRTRLRPPSCSRPRPPCSTSLIRLQGASPSQETIRQPDVPLNFLRRTHATTAVIRNRKSSCSISAPWFSTTCRRIRRRHGTGRIVRSRVVARACRRHSPQRAAFYAWRWRHSPWQAMRRICCPRTDNLPVSAMCGRWQSRRSTVGLQLLRPRRLRYLRPSNISAILSG